MSLSNSQLTGNTGQGILVLAVDLGTPFIELSINTPVAMSNYTISTTFALIDGELNWYNETFFGGRAGFCAVGAKVYATFAADQWPEGCADVQLRVFKAAQCVNGVIVPEGYVPPASTSPNIPLSTSPNIEPGVDGTPYKLGVYPTTASPNGQLCSTTTLSFYPGDSTFYTAGGMTEIPP